MPSADMRIVSGTEMPDVLVAEDDAAIRRLLALTLRRRRLHVEAAANGAEAMAALQRRRWDAVLLDLMMPEINGWEIVEWLGGHPESRPKSVIVMSAAGRDVLQNLDPTIVNAIIFKPFDVVEVGSYVKNIVVRAGSDRRRGRVVAQR